jgi:hypothetical protein
MLQGAGAAAVLPRNRAALALIFGMHMLALFAWVRQRPMPVAVPNLPRVVSILLRPAAPQPRPAPEEPATPVLPQPRRPSLPPKAGFPSGPTAPSRPAPSEPAAAPVTPVPAPAAPAATSGLEDARAPASVQDAIREQKQAEGGFGLNLSRRQAGRIDRELRKGKSGVPDEPDTPMGRFRRGLERAHIDPSNAVYEDSYTSPDGTITYRKRIGNATICRRSGSISPLGMRGMIMGNEAGDLPCPRGVQWKKD